MTTYPTSHNLIVSGLPASAAAAKAPQPADATPARTRTQRPCGAKSRCAAASNSAPGDDGPCAGQSNKRRGDRERRPGEHGGRGCQVRRPLQNQQSPALAARHRSHPRQNGKRAVGSNIGREHQHQRSDRWRRKAQNGDDEQNCGGTAQPEGPPITRQASAHPSGSRARELHLGSISRYVTAHALGP